MKLRSTPAWFVCLSLLAAPALAQNNNDPSKVKLVVNNLAPGISMIEGVEGFAGGNVGVSAGNDGVFIIDDELDTMTPKLQAELGKLSKQPLRFVLNTHWHGDHTGGNAAFGGSGAVILAHDNVRIRLSAAELEKAKDKVVAKPGAGLPVVTFAQDVTLHLNGDDAHAFHVPPAHTDCRQRRVLRHARRADQQRVLDLVDRVPDRLGHHHVTNPPAGHPVGL